MALPGYVNSMIASHVAGAALSGSTAETTLLPAQAKLTMPANWIEYIGQMFRLRGHGRISTVVTTPGTMTLKLKAGSTAILTSQALPLNIIAKTNVSWWLDLMVTVRANGAACTLMGQGPWISEAVIGSPLASAGGSGIELWQPSAPVVGTSFDATVTNVLDFTGQWSVNSGSNSILCEAFQIESVD